MTQNGKKHMPMFIVRYLTQAIMIGLFTASIAANGADQHETFCQNAGADNDYDCTKATVSQANATDIDSKFSALSNWLNDQEQTLTTPAVKVGIPESARLRDKITFNSQLLAAELKQAQQLQNSGDSKGAFDKVNSYLESNPNDLNGWLIYGISLINKNKLDDAADIFNQLIQLYPESPEPYNNLAVIHARKGDNDKAVKLLLQAFETHPSYAQVQSNLKALYAALAKQAYNRALNLNTTTLSTRADLNIIDQVYHPIERLNTPLASAPMTGRPAINIPQPVTNTTELIIEERQVSDGVVPPLNPQAN